MDFFLRLLDPAGFPARWFCGEWTPFHGWLYILSNLGIWAAYTTIPMLLVYFLSKRKDVPFLPIFWLFACFIYACGTTHLIDALMFWWPVYRFAAVILFATAVISWVTVIALIPAIPQALSLKSPRDLEKEINERISAETQLRQMNVNLALLVAERTLKLQAANKELEAFSYSVSHDLRAPLRHLDHFSASLQRKYDDIIDEAGQDYLQRMRNNVLRMDALIESLLKLSRLNRRQLQREEINLSEHARAIINEMKADEPDRQVEFIAPDTLMANGDNILVHQVLVNLLNNAWKYTQSVGQARIELGSEGSGPQTLYFVRDNGMGFEQADADDLFVPFKRMAYAREYEGTGIGLATVQRIVHRHGGQISAEGTPGEGAIFRFTLPPDPPEIS